MVRNNKGKGRGREKGEGKGGAGGGVAEIAGHLCSVGHPPTLALFNATSDLPPLQFFSVRY